MSPIDLKGQCGPLDLRFLIEIFWRDRKRQKELSHSLLFSLELKRRAEESKGRAREVEGLKEKIYTSRREEQHHTSQSLHAFQGRDRRIYY